MLLRSVLFCSCCSFSACCAFVPTPVPFSSLLISRCRRLGFAVSNYYFCTGNIEKSNEFVDKCISIGKTHERLTFGFMAALADKNARS